MTERQEIIDGLLQPIASISPKYFYDMRGSELFEEITKLPEYYPTRTERSIMLEHAQTIAKCIGPGTTLIELGAGNCAKARTLCRLIHPEWFVGVDISADFLRDAITTMRAEFSDLSIRAVAADMSQTFSLPDEIPRTKRLIFYPGSSIGNFDRKQAAGLLTRIRGLIEDDGALLIGIDLPKDVDVLEAAYDDALGITAAFNLNVLVHINRILGSDFDLDQWCHRAFFNPSESRIEMHLQARTEVKVKWPGSERIFSEGERIHTENSYKYALDDFGAMLMHAGFTKNKTWVDERNWFAVVYAHT